MTHIVNCRIGVGVLLCLVLSGVSKAASPGSGEAFFEDLSRAEARVRTVRLAYGYRLQRFGVDPDQVADARIRSQVARAQEEGSVPPSGVLAEYGATLSIDYVQPLGYLEVDAEGRDDRFGIRKLCLADRAIEWGRPGAVGSEFMPHHESITVKGLQWPPESQLEPLLMSRNGECYLRLLRQGRYRIAGTDSAPGAARVTLAPLAGPNNAGANRASLRITISAAPQPQLLAVEHVKRGFVGSECRWHYGRTGHGLVAERVLQTNYWPGKGGTRIPVSAASITITSAVVNQPLPAEVYSVRPPAGAMVEDHRFEQPLTYVQPAVPLTDEQLFYYSTHRRELASRYGLEWTGPLPDERDTLSLSDRMSRWVPLLALSLVGYQYVARRRLGRRSVGSI